MKPARDLTFEDCYEFFGGTTRGMAQALGVTMRAVQIWKKAGYVPCDAREATHRLMCSSLGTSPAPASHDAPSAGIFFKIESRPDSVLFVVDRALLERALAKPLAVGVENV